MRSPALFGVHTRWAPQLAGALLSLVIAVLLFTRFSINAAMSRDPAIYAYEGQQLSHGVPVYASIFDPKTPLAGMLAGLAAQLSRLAHVDQIHGIRFAFFCCACLTVLAVHVLTVRLWRSSIAGVVAATVLCSFQYFAFDALGGPDAKTPGILAGIMAWLLLAERRWFWAGIAASLSLLAWQPLAGYALVALGYTVWAADPGKRRRSLGLSAAGLAIPVVSVALYFWIAGALGDFIESALVFPLTGVKRGSETLVDRLHAIVSVARTSTGFRAWPFWAGLALLILVTVLSLVLRRVDLRRTVRDPLVGVVLPSLLLIAAYSCADFQGPPDLFPLLPFAALGFGGVAAIVLSAVQSPVYRRVVTAAGLVVVIAFAGLTVYRFDKSALRNRLLSDQRSAACALQRVLGPHGTLLALGTPVPLVLTGRRNPDRFIYLGSGIDQWRVAHTSGGFAGWTRQIRSYAPSVIVIDGWYGRLRNRMRAWLNAQPYQRGYLGNFRVFLTRDGAQRAKHMGVRVTHAPTTFAVGLKGHRLPGNCAR